MTQDAFEPHGLLAGLTRLEDYPEGDRAIVRDMIAEERERAPHLDRLAWEQAAIRRWWDVCHEPVAMAVWLGWHRDGRATAAALAGAAYAVFARTGAGAAASGTLAAVHAALRSEHGRGSLHHDAERLDSLRRAAQAEADEAREALVRVDAALGDAPPDAAYDAAVASVRVADRRVRELDVATKLATLASSHLERQLPPRDRGALAGELVEALAAILGVPVPRAETQRIADDLRGMLPDPFGDGAAAWARLDEVATRAPAPPLTAERAEASAPAAAAPTAWRPLTAARWNDVLASTFVGTKVDTDDARWSAELQLVLPEHATAHDASELAVSALLYVEQRGEAPPYVEDVTSLTGELPPLPLVSARGTVVVDGDEHLCEHDAALDPHGDATDVAKGILRAALARLDARLLAALERAARELGADASPSVPRAVAVGSAIDLAALTHDLRWLGDGTVTRLRPAREART